MELFQSLRVAWRSNQQRKEFEALWNAPDAYRPDASLAPIASRGRERQVPVLMLHRLATLGNQLGMTSGDVGAMANAMIRAIDEHRSYGAAFDEVLEDVRRGRLLTLSGHRLRDFVAPEAVVQILEMAAAAARPEAYAEYVEDEDPLGTRRDL